ncbi:uncharacterized protein LOC112026107 [Quercus suber]|uniref:uncharacterized protein LOC112026107 n=1 Tax=Quercus suber TaxID=58331 RepID=UPI0032DF5948
MGKKRFRIVNAEIEPQPQDPSDGSLGPNQSQDTLSLDHSPGPSANRSSVLLVPQPQADDNSDEESTNIEVQITDHAGVRSTRGITRMSEIWNLTDGKKVQLSFNGCFQPVEREGIIFNRFVGTVARKPNLCPINYFNWRKVPNDYKEKCWTIIESKFHISKNEEERKIIKRLTLKGLGEKWRNWKCALKAKHYDESKTAAGIVAEAPSTVNRQDFATLVNFWFSKDGLERSKAGKKASKKKKDVHTAGSKSYAQHAFDMFKKDGVAPNRGKLYVKLHKKKDGMPVNEDASEKIDKLKELMSQEASDLPEGANGSIAWCSTDAFSKVMGKEKHGRVRGLGFGPTPSNQSGSKNSCYGGIRITSEEERLKDDKIRRLTDKVSTLEDKLAMVMQHIQLPANTDLQVINM